MTEFLCPWDPSTYLFFSENVPRLIYYSHVVAIVSALSIGLFIFVNNPKATLSKLILLMVFLFSAWTTLDVVLWATNRPEVVMFSWSLQILLEPLTYTVAFYLSYLFLYKQWPSFWINVLIVLVLLPLILLLPTHYNLEALALSSCEAIEGPIAKYYTYLVHAVLTLAIIVMGAIKIPKIVVRRERIITLCFIAGLVTFLLAFSSGNIISSFTDDWTISQYGLFGMPIFSGLIAYSIVRFEAFNAKVIASQMLVVVLAITILSLTTLRSMESVRVIAILTFVLVCVLGALLIRSVQREVKQREHIEELAKELRASNEQQIVLIHFITHQLKGFMTKSRNLFSMLLEGDYGEVSDRVKPMLEEGLRSDTKGVDTIQEILNAANIKSGKVTYASMPVNMRELTEGLAKDLKPNADAKGLALRIIASEGDFTIQGDRMQLTNAIKNLIDNSIKYTPKGSVDISLVREKEKIRLVVKDTGVGITPEDMGVLFTEGGHGKESSKVNVESTGFGLYIVKNIIEAHHGTVWAESEGVGKGSRFTVELPVK